MREIGLADGIKQGIGAAALIDGRAAPAAPEEGSVAMGELRELLSQREREHRDTVSKLKELTVDFEEKRTALTTSAVRLEGSIVELRQLVAKGTSRA